MFGISVPGSEDERHFPGKQFVSHTIASLPSDIHVKNRYVWSKIVKAVERLLDGCRKAHAAEPQVGKHILEREGHDRFIFEDES